MRRYLLLFAVVCVSTFAAEPVNEEEELTLDLLEFLAEFGDQTDLIPVSADELDDEPLPVKEDNDAAPKVVHDTVVNDSKRGEQK